MKATQKSSGGTSFFGTTIYCSPNDLISVAKKFGAEYFEENTGRDKTNFDFSFENEDGDVFTVYDWKEYKALVMDRDYSFHIGAKGGYISRKSKEELLKELPL